jgi:ATP phosphoribosyltransferase
VAERLVDAIVEVTETGTTLKAHGLRIVDTLLETNTKLIANRASMLDLWKRGKIHQVALLLQGALNAESLVGLKMNVPEEKLEDVIGILPALTAPTIAQLYNKTWFSVETVINEKIVRSLIPRLIEKGADGIIEYSLNKVVNRSDAFLEEHHPE